ncbi:hypothetical protein E3E36_10825 [Thermococcus sp. M36]|uniref:hypothetical protein n=1 Tax=Thermococcus sp. M36 TaxID=1638261 RepID=UPI0014387873|nr:hypothetical protein [Thermococcus sp. M36]NJE06619.1 hypothetical protein [Thermococcus sp. M36]
MSEVVDFWNWVASEKARDRALERAEEPPDIITWLEREIETARETAFSLNLRGENGAEYWTGYADALEDLLKKIQRREVRA